MTNDFLESIDTGDMPDIGPDVRSSVCSSALLEQKVNDLGLDAMFVPFVRSAALLWHDHLDASHDISQNIPSSEGSFLHGIMHRREPDYPNAKYWFRRAGNHSSYPVLSSKLEDYLKAIEKLYVGEENPLFNELISGQNYLRIHTRALGNRKETHCNQSA